MAAVSPTMLAVLTIGVGALILGIMIGMHTMPLTYPPEIESKLTTIRRLTKEYYDSNNDADPVYQTLINEPLTEKIRQSLLFLSFEPHQAGSERDLTLAKYYESEFRSYGLDRVHMIPYKVLLSYSDLKRPNKIYVLDRVTNEANVISQHVEPPVLASELPQNVHAYNGFSPKGDISGVPVYCNYGRKEDFQLLEWEAHIDVKDKICIIRNGKIYRGNKVDNAAKAGCAAVILFSDPSTMAPMGTDPLSVYPNSIWMNGRAIQRGNIGLGSGDPLTEGFPSIEGSYRHPQSSSNVRLPNIPSQPIGYEDAKAILEQMDGTDTQENIKFRDWTGALNITYRLGPGFMTESKVLRIVVNNELVEKTIYNVVGILDGNIEPDRYVIVGNHRDSWAFGAMDAASGGSAMLESARVIGHYHNQTGWRPRRSMVFASWSGEELGLIGSTEWNEQWRHLLSTNAIAYLNVDTCVSGPIFKPDVSPSLMNVLREGTKRVPSHQIDKDMPLKVNQTIHDSWMDEARLNGHNSNSNTIKMAKLNSGSDHVPFSFLVGVPSINLEFTPNKRKYPVSSYPAYHTAYETFNLVTSHIDPDLSIHQSCSRLISILLYSLSCSTLVPVRLDELATTITNDYESEGLPKMLKEKLPSDDHQSIEWLESSMVRFANATANWHRMMEQMGKNATTEPYLVRQLNDIVIRVERVFTENSGRTLYNRPDTRNLIHGAPISDFYSSRIMPGIHDLINELDLTETMSRKPNLSHDELRSVQERSKELIHQLKRHLSDVGIALQTAARLLHTNPI